MENYVSSTPGVRILWDLMPDVIIIKIKHTVNAVRLNHPETIPRSHGLWKNCLPQNQPLVPKRLGIGTLQPILLGYQYFVTLCKL